MHWGSGGRLTISEADLALYGSFHSNHHNIILLYYDAITSPHSCDSDDLSVVINTYLIENCSFNMWTINDAFIYIAYILLY